MPLIVYTACHVEQKADNCSCCELLLTFLTMHPSDPCLMLSFIHLFPHKEDLLTKGAKMLVELASKQSSSEITLFEKYDILHLMVTIILVSIFELFAHAQER